MDIFEKIYNNKNCLKKSFWIVDSFFRSIERENIFYIDVSEKNKTLYTIEKIISIMLDLSINRDITVIGFGGGVTTDIAGFISAIYKRGVKLELYPTTLLAIVDASIGGKNGVNLNSIKNCIGTVKRADNIIIEFDSLKTLPKDQFISGWIEMVKIFTLFDKNSFFEIKSFPIDRNYNNWSENDINKFKLWIEKAQNLKQDIVDKDLYSNGIRDYLNFGHTLAHGVEILYQIPHGISVGLGIIFASFISKKLLNFKDSDIIDNYYSKIYNYNIVLNKINTKKIISILENDKKNSKNGFLDMILLKEIGDINSVVKKSLKIKEVEKLFNEFKKDRDRWE